MTGQLEGKIALITGGASGIGQAAAVRFAQEGAHIVVADRAGADTTLERVRDAGREGRFIACDVTDEDQCTAMVDFAVSEFGRVDAVVTAAGIATAAGPSNIVTRAEKGEAATHVVNLDVDAFRRVLDVNVIGTLLTARAAARQMLEQGSGSIVTIASTAGSIPLPGSSAYGVSKAGVIMLTKVLARELAATGVRVNSVAPGYTATPMTAGLEENEKAFALAMSITPMGRLGRPEEIAAACLFLAGDDSSFVTGEILHPAGGQFFG